MSENFFGMFQDQQRIFGPDPGQGSGFEARRQARLEGLRQDAERREQMRAQRLEEFKIPLNDKAYEYLFDGIKNGEMQEDDIYRLSAASVISQKYGIPLSEVSANLDEYVRADGINTDPQAKPQSLPRAVLNNALIGMNNVRSGKLKYSFMEADYLNPDEKYAEALRKEIEFLEEDSRALMDSFPKERNFAWQKVYDVLTSAAQTTPYMAYMAFHQTAGAVAGTPLMIPEITGPAAGFIAGFEVEAGNEYWVLRSLKDAEGKPLIDKDICWNIANIAGAASSAIEQFFFGTMKKMGTAIVGKDVIGKASKFIAGNVFKSLQQNGALYKAAVYLTDYLLGHPQEMGEEGLQSLVMAAGTAIATELQNARLEQDISGLPPEEQEAVRALRKIQQVPFNEIVAEAVGEMKAALNSNLVLGIVPLGIGAKNTLQQSKEARTVALKAESKEEHRALSGDLDLYKGMEPEIKQAAQDQVYDSLKPIREREEAARAAELKNRRLYGAMDSSGDVYRGEGGGLYMEVTGHEESGGLRTVEFAAGDPGKSEKNSYAIGAAEYRGDKLVVTEFRIGEKYEGLKGEILQGLANDMGAAFEFEGQPYAPGGEGKSMRYGWLAEQAAAPKTAGFDHKREYYSEPDSAADTAAKQAFARRLASLDTKLGGEAAAQTVVDFYDTVGRKWFGTGFDAFMKRLTGDNIEGLLTQELSDEQVARWMAKNEGLAADADAVARIRENLTDAQRQAARENIHGFAVTGADGVTKALYAARDADMSTFVHEGVHAFTQLAKAADPELYRQMMQAAGFDQKAYNAAGAAGKERMMRDAMEKLAYGAEAYLKNGPQSVSNSALKNLYERLKEFLKDLRDAARKAKYLTPEVAALFDQLFGDGGLDAVGQGQEASGGQAENGKAESAEELEIYSDSFDRIIKDESRPAGERAEAAEKKAQRDYGDALLDGRDRGHRPTAELIKRAMKIADAAERQRVIAELRELRRQYAGTAAEYKAPNGKPSRLLETLGEEKGREAWYAVRTGNFKEWFGDWERAARIAAVENLDVQKIKTGEPKSKKEIENLAQSFKKLKNKADGRIADMPISTIGKILGHKGYDVSKIIEDIPSLYETSLWGWSEPEIQKEGHKQHRNIKAFHQYINKFADSAGEYYIRFTVNETNAKPGKTGENKIHSTAISDIAIYEKGDGSGRFRVINPGVKNTSPFTDSKLAEFFNSVKGNVSKIVDGNGEPLAAFHGTNADFAEFDPKKSGTKSQTGAPEGTFFFTDSEAVADSYTVEWQGDWSAKKYEGARVLPVFLNVKNPLTVNAKGENWADILYKGEYRTINELAELAQKAGKYDGLIVKKVIDKGRGNVTYGKNYAASLVVFDPSQIKSATDNAGTFSNDDYSILFQEAFHANIDWDHQFDNSYLDGSRDFVQSRHGWGHRFNSQKEVAEWHRQAMSKYAGSVEGQLYEAEIPGDEELLDWDKPVSAQAEAVQNAAERLIAWNEAGVSNFNPAYNLRAFTDGSVGFYRSINGKAKWADAEEAKAAARAEIKKTLTGKDFYNTLAQKIGAKQTSLLLDYLGVRGTKYFDKSHEKAGLAKGYNYVIFGDSGIQNVTGLIEKTAALSFNFDGNALIPYEQAFYSERFRDAEFEAFMANYPELVQEAARFENGADMAAHYADYMAMPDEVYAKARAAGYFDALARAAKEGSAENATNAAAGVSAKKAVTGLAAYGVGIRDSLEAARLARQGDWAAAVELLEKAGAARIDAEAYADAAKLFTHSEWNWLKRKAEESDQEGANANQRQVIPNADSGRSGNPNIAQTPGKDISKNKKNILGTENAAVQKYFNTLVEGAKEIHPDHSIEELRAELAGEPRTARAFTDMIRTEAGFDGLMRGVYAVLRDGPERGNTDEETRQNELIHDKARRVFNPEGNGNWKAALADIAAGRRVNAHTKKIIQGMIRNRPLQYMEAWAMMTGDDTWLPNETDAQRIRRLDTEGLVDEEYLEKQSPEELERIGRRLSSDRVKKKIDEGTLLVDDPELNEHERQLREDMAKYRALIAEREEGLKEWRQYLELAERNARKEQMLLEQQAADTSREGLKASRKQVKETAKAQRQVRDVIDQLERFMREDLTPTQRAAFVELRKQLRERERIQAELKAIEEIRDIKKADFRQILRKPDLKAVDIGWAAKIEWVQAHFDSYQAVARFVGRGAKDIRQLYNEFATSPEYREKLKKKLPALAYHQIERTVFKDLAGKEVRAYGELDSRQRKALHKHLVDYQGIFEEMGIDITEDRRAFSATEWEAMRVEMRDIIPADALAKLEGLIAKDEHGNRKFKVENFTIEDLQTLAGAVNRLRKEGREALEARREARAQLRQEAADKTLKIILDNLPKNAAKRLMPGTAQKRLEEEKRSGWRSMWYGLHNMRRLFRTLEGGKDGFLHDYYTQREYDAFDEENRRFIERTEKVERQLKDNGIDIKGLWKNKFTLWNGTQATLSEMLTFYYAQRNERALNAVVFGNFATPDEWKQLEGAANARDIAGQMVHEAEIAKRYLDDMKKLDAWFAQSENGKYRKAMEIIGADFDEHYPRLKEFVARQYNEELGSEQNYMPLIRLSPVAQENENLEQALIDNGLAQYINKGFTKGRVDIPSWGQRPIRAGLYEVWSEAVRKQEHLMAYDPLMREMRQIFEGPGSERLKDALERGYSGEALKQIKKFISEMGSPAAAEDVKALNFMNRIMRGHFPAAVLGWRAASILKQAVESPPPFLQYVYPWEYAGACVSCLRQQTRDMIRQKSVYLKVRYFDPAMSVAKEIERMALMGGIGKAEAALAKAENIGMMGQAWIDSVCVMPGWLAAYNRKLGELNRDEAGISAEEAEAKAARYADGVVRDCQPSSVAADQVSLLKDMKHPLARMFAQFQTPIASIFQQLFIDAPANMRNGRVAQGLWTWGIYALLAVVTGAMFGGDDDDDDTLKDKAKNRAIDALAMPIEYVPVIGGDAAFAAEDLLRNGRIRTPQRSYFPVVDQGIKGINAISKKQWDKAGWAAVKGFGYYTGLPVGLVEDVQKAAETGKPQRVLGIK